MNGHSVASPTSLIDDSTVSSGRGCDLSDKSSATSRREADGSRDPPGTVYQFVCYDDDTMIKVVLALQTLLAAVVGEKSKIGTVRETLSSMSICVRCMPLFDKAMCNLEQAAGKDRKKRKKNAPRGATGPKHRVMTVASLQAAMTVRQELGDLHVVTAGPVSMKQCEQAAKAVLKAVVPKNENKVVCWGLITEDARMVNVGQCNKVVVNPAFLLQSPPILA